MSRYVKGLPVADNETEQVAKMCIRDRYSNAAIDQMLASQSWVCPIEYTQQNPSALYNKSKEMKVKDLLSRLLPHFLGVIKMLMVCLLYTSHSRYDRR